MKTFCTYRFLVAVALAMAACGSAASAKGAAEADTAGDVPTKDTATGEVSSDSTPLADGAPTDTTLADTAPADVADSDAVALDSAGDASELTDTAGDALDAGPLADTAAEVADAPSDALDGGPGETSPFDATPADGTQDSADVCSGGLPDCPKKADGPAGTPPTWLGSDCLAPVSPDWQEAGLKPTPELTVELGPLESGGTWTPYSDGGWAALYHGPQGLVHTELAIRVSGIGGSAPQLTASVMRGAYLGCAAKTSTIPFAVGLTLVPGGNYFSSNMGLLAIWDMGSNSWKYCGQWAELHVAVRVPDGRWGEGKVRVRLWDTAATCPPP